MEVIFALILVAAGGEAQPEYQKVYKTEAGCERAIHREVGSGEAETGWCYRMEVPFTQPAE